MATSPSTGNYHIGKGVVTFTPTNGVNRDLGNCPSFIYTPTVEKKDHFSSRQGIKKKDLTVITQVGATIKMKLDEITGENLQYFALSSAATTVSDGNISLAALSQTTFTGHIFLTGTNDVGNKVDFECDISFIPSGDFSFITDGDDFSVIELEAEVVADSGGNYGTWTIHG